MAGKKWQRVNDKNVQGKKSQGVPDDEGNDKKYAEQVSCEKLL